MTIEIFVHTTASINKEVDHITLLFGKRLIFLLAVLLTQLPVNSSIYIRLLSFRQCVPSYHTSHFFNLLVVKLLNQAKKLGRLRKRLEHLLTANLPIHHGPEVLKKSF